MSISSCHRGKEREGGKEREIKRKLNKQITMQENGERERERERERIFLFVYSKIFFLSENDVPNFFFLEKMRNN